MVLKRVDPMSCARISGAMYVLIGLFSGLIFGAMALIGAAAGAAAREEGGQIFGALFGMGAVIFLPVMYGVMGFIGGLVMAVAYNWLAGVVGGIQIELGDAR